ncbi:uncharacterized protein LOC111351266 isoform X2 [Spodoptera litura]|uniref:Uncharacterized protein LOC111351266 isoform X2 n=1 Tax=Spodoptera litura TaxID=69820 RepID=A0A9J7DYZ0_SPOLT|nr:uncharacterized protein LOC111351266 isoform X2 [Spodoptera litura]
MRSSRRSKNKEKSYERINKNRYKNRWSRFGWGSNDAISSGPFLENLNEILREKYHQSEGKGNWKIMPRDSCEIYKARQKRMESSRRKYNNDSNESDHTVSDDDDDRRSKKKQRKKTPKKREPPKNFRPRGPRGKNKKRNPPRSRAVSKSSDTNSSFTRTTSYTTVSDMDD